MERVQANAQYISKLDLTVKFWPHNAIFLSRCVTSSLSFYIQVSWKRQSRYSMKYSIDLLQSIGEILVSVNRREHTKESKLFFAKEWHHAPLTIARGWRDKMRVPAWHWPLHVKLRNSWDQNTNSSKKWTWITSRRSILTIFVSFESSDREKFNAIDRFHMKCH